MRVFLAGSALLALAACNKPAATPPRPPPVAASPAVVAPEPEPELDGAPVNPVVTITTYACTGGKPLEAGYPNPTSAVVIWQGHAYTLSSAPAASGARYTGFGLQWWTRGPTHGTLATLKAGEQIATDPGVDCVAGEPTPVTPATPGTPAAPVNPPAPGTPGGLPDDKTPISEAPFSPTSAQGAAKVVQTYYALLERRSSVDAAKYRADGTPENLSQYSSLHAQVGAPGAIQGAAGSLSVEVPVVLSGRLADGSAFHRSGKVVLRRINNVPGSTPAQREWRIERFNLK
jgi:membrane-bound inhibitor of C-type lysozyme